MTPLLFALAGIGALAVAALVAGGCYLAGRALVRAVWRSGETLPPRDAEAWRRVLDDGHPPPLRLLRGGKGRRR